MPAASPQPSGRGDRCGAPRPTQGAQAQNPGRWLREDSPARLRDGHHLYPGPGGSWRLYGPGDRLARLRLPAPHAAALADLLRGERPVAAVLTEADDAASLCRALDAFDRQGLLVLAEASAGGALDERRVLVEGDNPIAAQLVALLRSSGVGEVRIAEGPSPPADADLLVACAGWLPDTQWLLLDQWSATSGCAWHMCYTEGGKWYLGPVALPGRTAGYADTRARRLAAAAHPDELEALWRYLDSGQAPPAPLPEPPALAMITGLLAQDTLAVLRGSPPASQGCQLEIDPALLTLTRHPVLPVPRDLMATASP